MLVLVIFTASGLQVDFHSTPSSTGTNIVNLPIEVIEHIALNIRYTFPGWSGWEPAQELLQVSVNGDPSAFILTKQNLVAFSQTCSFLRGPAERVLYQDIRLNFHGWREFLHNHEVSCDTDGSDQSDSDSDSVSSADSETSTYSDIWPTAYTGSLPFLLRTLDQRPDLGLYVRSVCVDWYDNRAFTKGFEMEGALIRLFECCPRLQRLVIPDLPSIDTIMKMSASQITTLACVYSPEVSYALAYFTLLRNLYCRDFGSSHSSFLWELRHHNITTLELDGHGADETSYFGRALELCTVSVHELTLRHCGVRLNPGGPVLALGIPDVGRGLVTLRVKGLCILNHISGEVGQILRNLPLLRHLHLNRHSPLTPGAFTLLPRSIETLTLSEYALLGDFETRDDIIHALVNCLLASGSAHIHGWGRKVTQIVAVIGARELVDVLGDLKPLQQFCDAEGISFTAEAGDPNTHNSALRIICKLAVTHMEK